MEGKERGITVPEGHGGSTVWRFLEDLGEGIFEAFRSLIVIKEGHQFTRASRIAARSGSRLAKSR